MTFQDLATSNIFWNSIKYLENMKGSVDKKNIIAELGITELELYSLLTLLHSYGSQFEFKKIGDIEALTRCASVTKQGTDIFGTFSTVESMQMVIFYASQIDCEFAKDLKDFYNKLLNSNEFKSLANFTDKVSSNFTSRNNNILTFKNKNDDSLLKMERAIFNSHVLSIFCRDQQTFRVLPFKVMKLDGELTLIAEDIDSAECIHLSLNGVSFVEEFADCHKPLISKLEFEDYINSLREFKETHVRLILKVDESIELEDSVAYQHFGNACLIKKGKGHMIWAASVEPTDELFEWISNMGAGVEIIDPSAFKRVYLRYCEDKLMRVG